MAQDVQYSIQVSGKVPDLDHKQDSGTNGAKSCCLDTKTTEADTQFQFNFVSPQETWTTYQCRCIWGRSRGIRG